MDKFGNIFERYVDKSIQYSSSNYVKEADLKPLIREKKCVDFVILEDNGLVFIDAKGVEMSSAVKTTDKIEYIIDRTKGSILKAIDQAYSTYNQLENLQSKIPKSFHSKDPYVIVVTYKEHYLGNGNDFSTYVAKEKIDNIASRYPNVTIPLHNVYFINIEEFDSLCESIRCGKTSFSDALFAAKMADENIDSKKFCFIQHLYALELASKPTWLVGRYDYIVDEVAEVLTNASANES
jgi:hypothetical protein